MDSANFITYNINGSAKDVIEKAIFLRKLGFRINVSNGNVFFSTANEYMRALLLLQKCHKLNREEKKIWMRELYQKIKYTKTLNKKFRFCNQGKNRVIMYHGKDDFLSIIRQRNKETGKYEYIVFAQNKDPDCLQMEKYISPRISSYYISKDNPLFEMAATRYQGIFMKEDSPISFEPTTNGYLLNFKDTKPVSCYPGTCVLKFGADNPIITELFQTLQTGQYQPVVSEIHSVGYKQKVAAKKISTRKEIA